MRLYTILKIGLLFLYYSDIISYSLLNPRLCLFLAINLVIQKYLILTWLSIIEKAINRFTTSPNHMIEEHTLKLIMNDKYI